MVEVKVIKRFIDASEQVTRLPGDIFQATEERAEEIATKIPGYIEFKAIPEKKTKKAKKTKKTAKKD